MIHEDLAVKHHVSMGSGRAFGLVFAGFFTLLSAFAWWNASPLLPGCLAAAAVFALAALIAPQILHPLNVLWFRFGLLLNAVVSPIILGFLYYLVITPVGLLMRICRARPLHLKFDPGAESYWIPRDPPGPDAGSMQNQF